MVERSWGSGVAAILTASLLAASQAFGLPAGPWDAPPHLDFPTPHTVEVATVAELNTAVFNLQPDTTILIAPGTYRLTEKLAVGHLRTLDNIAIRGATGNRDDVVLLGAGMDNPAIDHGIEFFDVHNSLIADLTVGEVYNHPIHLAGDGTDPDDPTNPSAITIHNCRIRDGGEQLIKAQSCHDSLLQYSVIGFTGTSKKAYSQGVDGYNCRRFTVRHNLFHNQRGPAHDPVIGAAILFWAGAQDPLIEGNTVYNSRQGISLGLDPTNNCVGGMIRNNFIYRAADSVDSPDSGILVWYSPSVKVIHNTVILNQTGVAPIEYREAAGLWVHSNLLDPQNPVGGADAAIWYRGGSYCSNVGNEAEAMPAWFVSATAANLRLTATTAAALAQVARSADCLDDWDGDARSDPTDVGADQYRAPTSRTVACQSVFPVDAAFVQGLPTGRFLAKPKTYATYVHPVTDKRGKAAVKVLTKIDKANGTATLSCEWTKKIRLYDAKAFKAAEAAGIGAATWITTTTMADLPMTLRLTGKEAPDQEVQPLILAVPVINDIQPGEPDPKTGSDTVIVAGQWLGAKPPKAWREYLDPKTNLAIKRQAMKVVKPTAENSPYLDSKLKPACMDPETGASRVIVLMPAKPPAGAPNGTLVLDNGVGLAAGNAPAGD
jgi:hypothetical protein